MRGELVTEPNTERMEELLKMMNEQQLQDLSGTRPLHSRPTARLRRSPATNGIPASRTNFGMEADKESAQPPLASDVEPTQVVS
jgi:hypothetical protein